MNHTSGPWEIVEHNWRETTVESKDSTVCSLEFYLNDDSNEKDELRLANLQRSNAALISAAPDMLEVLREIMNRYATLMTEKMVYKMDRAIKKATS